MTKKKIKEFADLKTDKNKVLLTHMAPCFLSIPEHKRTNKINSAYYEDISEMLMDSDIKVACHGHVHDPVDYVIGNTRIVSNPRGYNGKQTAGKTFEFKIINSQI
jgi:Icc-related predicted phosphoesterase